MIIAHLVDEQNSVTRATLREVPRVGEVLRLRESRFFTVERVVWCLDEDTDERRRVNLGGTWA